MNTIVLKPTDKAQCSVYYKHGQFFKSEKGQLFLLARFEGGTVRLVEIANNYADRTDDGMNKSEYTLDELTIKAGVEILTPIDVTITEN